jgi:hypothetical protein
MWQPRAAATVFENGTGGLQQRVLTQGAQAADSPLAMPQADIGSDLEAGGGTADAAAVVAAIVPGRHMPVATIPMENKMAMALRKTSRFRPTLTQPSPACLTRLPSPSLS